MAQGQAKLDVVDFQEAVSEIETVLQNTHDKEQSARLQRALSILKNNAVTLQIGGQEVTIIANSKLTVSQENDSRITYDPRYSIHYQKQLDLELKQLAQKKFEESHSREKFIEHFIKSYL